MAGWWSHRGTLHYHTCSSTRFFQTIKHDLIRMTKPPTQSTVITVHDADSSRHLPGDRWRPGATPVTQMKDRGQGICQSRAARWEARTGRQSQTASLSASALPTGLEPSLHHQPVSIWCSLPFPLQCKLRSMPYQCLCSPLSA